MMLYLDCNPLEFDEDTTKTNILLVFITLGKIIVKLLKSSIRENNIRSKARNEKLSFHKEINNISSAFIPGPDYINFPLRQLIQNKTKCILYSSQITYSFILLPKLFKASQSSSFANFVSSHTAKSYKHMIQVLCMLSFNINNEETNKPKSLKKTMTRLD